MSISFQCKKCGKQYETADETAGKTARCKQCGNQFTIPRPAKAPAADHYDLDEPAPLPPRAPAPMGSKPAGGASRGAMGKVKPKSKSAGSGVGKSFGGVMGVVFLAVFLGLRGYRIYLRTQRANNPQGQAQGNLNQRGVPAGLRVDRNGPIAVPPLPELGPGQEIAPGVIRHEARLPGGNQPGFSGKLWVYLPSGTPAPRSLPCVLITCAGTTLLYGTDIGDAARPEHLPYVHAGFAVVAFELDGHVQGDPPSEAELDVAVPKFLGARAGLVNAHVALEFVLAKVPQVDPSKIFAAGHSSAGTLAMLFAEHEPRLKGCVAYAPAIDLEKRFGPKNIQEFQRVGIGDLAVRYSPKNNEAKLNVPLFLFHARDDSNVPYSESEASGATARGAGKVGNAGPGGERQSLQQHDPAGNPPRDRLDAATGRS